MLLSRWKPRRTSAGLRPLHRVIADRRTRSKGCTAPSSTSMPSRPESSLRGCRPARDGRGRSVVRDACACRLRGTEGRRTVAMLCRRAFISRSLRPAGDSSCRGGSQRRTVTVLMICQALSRLTAHPAGSPWAEVPAGMRRVVGIVGPFPCRFGALPSICWRRSLAVSAFSPCVCRDGARGRLRCTRSRAIRSASSTTMSGVMPFGLDRASEGVVARRGQLDGCIVRQRQHGLHRALAEGLRAHHHGALWSCRAPGDDLGGRRRSAIDEHHERHVLANAGKPFMKSSRWPRW